MQFIKAVLKFIHANLGNELATIFEDKHGLSKSAATPRSYHRSKLIDDRCATPIAENDCCQGKYFREVRDVVRAKHRRGEKKLSSESFNAHRNLSVNAVKILPLQV